MNITLYTTNCPKCKILKKKLDDKHISYEIVSDVNTMLDLGIRVAPILKVDEKMLDFGEAVRYVNTLN